jgi:hypothetical protein
LAGAEKTAAGVERGRKYPMSEPTKTVTDNLKPARGIVRGLAVSAVLWALAFAAAAFWI